MKNSIIIFLILNVFLYAFMSCDKMEDIHAEYVENGEIIYANVPDSLISMPGNQRIKIKWLVYNGKNIEKSTIEWEDDGELKSYSTDVFLNNPLDSVIILLDDLSEKSYVFKAYNVDWEGNRSIKKEVTGSVYGSIYETLLKNRPLTGVDEGIVVDPESLTVSIDSVLITWGSAYEGCIGTEVLYNDSVGNPVSKMIASDNSKLVVKSWESEGEMKYRSFYLPAPNAIDTFATSYQKVKMPNENVLPPECLADVWSGNLGISDNTWPDYQPTYCLGEKIDEDCSQLNIKFNLWGEADLVWDLDFELGEIDPESFTGSVTLLETDTLVASWGETLIFYSGEAGTYNTITNELNLAFDYYDSDYPDPEDPKYRFTVKK